MDCVVPTIRYLTGQAGRGGHTSQFSLKVRGNQPGSDGDPAYSEIPLHRALELWTCSPLLSSTLLLLSSTHYDELR